jgi:hypothetical protein
MAGKRVRCPACQEVLAVPELSSAVVPAGRVGAAPALNLPPSDPDMDAPPEPFRSSRRRQQAKPEMSTAKQIGMAVVVGLLVMVTVTSVIVTLRGGQAGTVAAANAGGGAGFKEFVSPEGKFRVMMPGTPVRQQQRLGPISITMYTLQNSNGAYVVAFCDVPIPVGESDFQLQKRLDGARMGALGNVGGVLVKENRVFLQGRDPGREIEANAPGKGLIRARFFIASRRMYQIMVVGNPQFVHSADATRFLDSLSRTN